MTAPLYQRFVEDELALAPALVARVLAGTVQLLGPSRDAGTSAGERSHHSEIVKALQRDAGLFEKTFVESLSKRIREETEGPRETSLADARAGLGSLELMDEARVEVDIEISRAMQLIDSTAEWELRELQTFTSTLVGQKHVNAESNPFRPLVYVSALWDATCAVVTSQIQRAIVLRTAAGVIAGLLKNAWAAASTRLESAGVQPGTYRTVILPSGAAFGRFAAPEPPRPGALSALLPSMPGAAYGSGRGRDDGSVPLGASEGVRRRSRRAQRWRAATQPGARAGPAPARRAAAPPAVGSVAHRTQLARRQSPRTASRRPGRQRQRADRPAGDRARHPAVRIAARRLAAPGRLQAGDRAHADRRAARRARRQRGARLVRPSGLAPARPDRRGQPRLFADRGSAPVELPVVRQRGRGGDGRGRGAGHGTLPPRPQPDRRPSVGAAAGPAARGAGLGRCAAAFRAARDPAAASRPAAHRSDGAGAHDADDPPLRHHHLGPGDRRGHAHQGRAVGSDDERPEDGRRPALEPEDPRPSAKSPAAAASAARPAESVARRHGAGRPGAAGAAGRAQRADDDPHRGASSRHQGVRRAHARGDRAEHARRGPAGRRRRAASAIR